MANTAQKDSATEQVAHNFLALAGNHPAKFGRLKAARIVGGYAVRSIDDGDDITERYKVDIDWTLRDLVDLVDALLAGGLLSQSDGPRPRLCLTRTGFRALEAMELVAEEVK